MKYNILINNLPEYLITPWITLSKLKENWLKLVLPFIRIEYGFRYLEFIVKGPMITVDA